MNVKTASTRNLIVLVAAALVLALMAVPVAADSIGTVYDMDRMLSEPHPLADQYGTRWQPSPASAPVLAPVPTPTPSPFPATAPEPPPITFAPPEPPPFGKTTPPPSQPAPLAQPVAKVTPVESPAEPTPEPAPPPAMAPRLSIDAGGVDLEPDADKAALAVMEKIEMEKAQPEAVKNMSDKEFAQPGPRPPPPSITPPR